MVDVTAFFAEAHRWDLLDGESPTSRECYHHSQMHGEISTAKTAINTGVYLI
jgi:hypothetical protein